MGLSLLSGAHLELAAETLAKLKEYDGEDIKVFVGGTIPLDDRRMLLEAGVSGVFTSEMKLEDVLVNLERSLA